MFKIISCQNPEDSASPVS